MRKAKAFSSYRVKPNITAKMNGKTFRAHGEVKLTANNKSLSLVFECVRRDEDWKTKLIERIRLYKDFFENFVPFDSGFESKPEFILICEDEKHMVETFKEIISNNIEIEKTKIYFSTDLKHNSSTLDKSLISFTFDEATGKYKALNSEFKLLG